MFSLVNFIHTMLTEYKEFQKRKQKYISGNVFGNVFIFGNVAEMLKIEEEINRTN